MFEKLGFEIVKRVEVFGEVEMRLTSGRSRGRDVGVDVSRGLEAEANEETRWVEEIRRGGGWVVKLGL